MHKIKIAFIATCLTLGSAIPAQASTVFVANLSGRNEVPTPNASTATGTATIIINDARDRLDLRLVYSGLTAGAIDYHLHCCIAAGANTGVAIDIDFTEGLLSDDFSASFNLLDPTIYRAAFLAGSGGTAEGARDRFFAGYLANLGYFNVHSSAFPGGEIRGQFAAVPEPATWAMMIAGFGLVGAGARRRRVTTALA